MAMQTAIRTLSDIRSETKMVDAEELEDRQRMDENAPPEWLLPCQIHETILWPRVFPGL